MSRWFLFLTLFACARATGPASVTLSRGWVLAVGDSAVAATVPGHVLLDLEAAGLVPDAYCGTNEPVVQWVEEVPWRMTQRAAVPEGWGADASTHLECEGLDTYARVWVDGELVLEADNAHRSWRSASFPAGRGERVIQIEFEPVAAAGMARLEAAALPVPCSNEDRPVGRQTSPFTRKAGYQFGWDWGPRLAGPGVTGAVRWVRDGEQAPSPPWCEVLAADAEEARVWVHGRVGWELDPRVPATWCGDTLVFARPQLWWPRGMGEAALYPLRWRHTSGVEHAAQLGLRTVELDRTDGAFQFIVNGVPVFARGANVVPPDFHVVQAEAAWPGVVEDAVAAGMNMLRVWGGGGYPPSSFYAACDEAGVLVWQDFAFACAMVPGDAAFRANVRAEAVEQVRRLRPHACLALWCGNNESELAWERWGWQDAYGLHGADSAAVAADYAAIFEGVLPEVVAAESAAAYWPSSPHGGGDEHAWGVWFGLEDFGYYSRHGGRFASEYGLQSLPSRHTLRAAGIEAFGDSALQYRQRSRMDWLEPGFDGWDMMAHFMGKTVGLPAEGDLDQWIFLSQTTQALGLQHALERHRTSAGRIAGSLYWSLNDVWPAVSWSTVDHAGRWKLGHYAARRANAPRTVQWQRERTDSLVLIAFNDGPAVWSDSVQLELKTPDGQVRQSARRAFSVSAHGSIALNFGALAELQADPGHTYLAWEVADERTSVLWDMPVAFHRPSGHLEARATHRGLELEAAFYEPVVGLTANVPGHFRDNGFALEAGERLHVEFVPEDAEPTSYTIRTLGHPEGITLIRSGGSTGSASPSSRID